MKVYLSFLRHNSTILTLSLVQLICYFGAWFSNMAIYTLLINLKAPDWTITAVAILTFLPTMILAPLTGIIIDRFPTKQLLLFLLAIETVTVCMLIFINSLDFVWLLLVLVFIRMGVGSTYFQAEMSLLPKLLNISELKIANEIHSIIWSISYTAGMGFAGLYIYFFGVKIAFITDALLFTVGFVLLLKLKLPQTVIKKTTTVFVMLKDGLLYIKNNPKIFHLILLHASVGISTYDALVALLAKYSYVSILAAPLTIGFINTIRAFALTIGSVVLSRFISEKSLHVIFILQGIGIILWGVLQFNFYMSFIGIIMSGFFTSILWSYTYTMLQKNTKREFYGRVIAYNDMFIMGVCALISFLIGALYEFGFSLRNITIMLGVFFLLVSVYWLYLKNRYFTQN